MNSLIESPRAAFVSGSSLPASLPLSLSKLLLPLLCITLGVSVGTATGLTLALVNAPGNAMAASSESMQATVQASPTSATPAANLAMNSSPAPVTNPMASPANQATPLAASPSQPSATATSNASSTVSKPAESNSAKLNAAPATPKVELALNKTPDALKPATFTLDGKQWHAARMMYLPAAKPQRHESDRNDEGAALSAAPTNFKPAQLSLDSPAPATVYTEGDLTVSEYDAASRTVETSDGKTFVLGTTVMAGSAASWESYRSDVHYRCDQNGSCVLMRAGVVAPNARLI
jgi:hypothetical protein